MENNIQPVAAATRTATNAISEFIILCTTNPSTIELNRLLTEIMLLLKSAPFAPPKKPVMVNFLLALLQVESRTRLSVKQILTDNSLQFLAYHYYGVSTTEDTEPLKNVADIKPLFFHY